MDKPFVINIYCSSIVFKDLSDFCLMYWKVRAENFSFPQILLFFWKKVYSSQNIWGIGLRIRRNIYTY